MYAGDPLPGNRFDEWSVDHGELVAVLAVVLVVFLSIVVGVIGCGGGQAVL